MFVEFFGTEKPDRRVLYTVPSIIIPTLVVRLEAAVGGGNKVGYPEGLYSTGAKASRSMLPSSWMQDQCHGLCEAIHDQ